jgi:hypothetical protein
VPAPPGWVRAHLQAKRPNPILYVPGEAGAIRSSIEFDAEPIKGVPLKSIVDDRARGIELVGAAILEKKVAGDGLSATLRFSTARIDAKDDDRRIDMTVRETYRLYKDHVVRIAEQFTDDHKARFDAASAQIVAGIKLGPPGVARKEDLPTLEITPMVVMEDTVEWEVAGPGATLRISHPASWKHTTSTDGNPVVYKEGAKEKEMLAMAGFDLKRGLGGQSFANIINGIVSEREKAGRKIKKVLPPGGRQATLEYTVVDNNLPVTVQQTFILINNDAICVVTAKASAENWGNFERQLHAIAESVRVTVGRP